MSYLQLIAVGLLACIPGGVMLALETMCSKSDLAQDAATNAVPRATAADKPALAGKPLALCLKSLQEGKFVFIAVPGTNEAVNQTALQGIKDMAADERFAGATETIQVRADDESSADLLAKLKVTDAGKTSLTLLLVPPGRVAGTYTGATDKAAMISDVTRAMAGAT